MLPLMYDDFIFPAKVDLIFHWHHEKNQESSTPNGEPNL